MSSMIQTRAARRPPLRLCGVALAAALAATPAGAAIEDGYDPGGAPVPTTWWEAARPAALKADRDFVAGMRPHHAGALTMSQAYLADPQASSPVLRALAQAILRNQRFEIRLLDEVSRNLDLPPVVLNLGITRLVMQPSATEGLAQLQRFQRSPIPAAALAGPNAPVSARDVQFAKGMTLHHQAALDMARAYHANPAARNGFLGLLNIDIITDQAQEIALMQAVVAGYPGDPDAVLVDASMIHGMEGMAHGGMAMPQPAAAPQAAGQPAPSPAPSRQRVPRAHAAPGPAATPSAHEGHSGH
jgi:uncharacterized protein (DUF305 family)